MKIKNFNIRFFLNQKIFTSNILCSRKIGNSCKFFFRYLDRKKNLH